MTLIGTYSDGRARVAADEERCWSTSVQILPQPDIVTVLGHMTSLVT